MLPSVRIASLALACSLSCTAHASAWKVVNGNLWFLNGIHFVDANTGFVVGFHATALRTTDAGATWRQMSLPISNDVAPITVFSGVGFATPQVGCMAFDDSILCTTDGGVSWRNASVSQRTSISSFIFVTSRIGYATGSTTSAGSGILKTLDGGASWQHVAGPAEGGDIAYIGGDFRTENHGIVIIRRGTPGCVELWRTTDACQSWRRLADVNVDTCSSDIAALTHVAGTTWLLGAKGIVRSTDDGDTWTKVSIFPQPSAFAFADSTTGYAASERGGTTYKTTNGGVTWVSQHAIIADSVFYVRGLSAPTPDLVFGIGYTDPTKALVDAIIESTDGGGFVVPVREDAPDRMTLSLYPNPVNADATIDLVASPEPRRIVIRDMLGIDRAAFIVPASQTSISLRGAELQPGLYFCVVGMNVVRFAVVR